MGDHLLEEALDLERRARALGAEGDDRAAQACFLRMKAVLVDRAAAMPGDLQALRDIAAADRWLAMTATSLGQHKEARRFATDAYRACKSQCHGDHAKPEPERALRLCCRQLSDAMAHLERHDDAVRYAQEGVDLARWLATIPCEDAVGVREQLAHSLETLGVALWAADRPEDALRVHRELVELARGLDLMAEDGWARSMLARGLSLVGEILASRERLEEARAACGESIREFGLLLRQIEASVHDRHCLGITHRRAGIVAARLGDLSSAAHHLVGAVDLSREAATAAPDAPYIHWALHDALSELALIRHRQGDEPAGRALLREAMEVEARLRRR